MKRPSSRDLLSRVLLCLLFLLSSIATWAAPGQPAHSTWIPKPPASHAPDAWDLKVTFLDVGQGDCILLRTKQKTIMIDAGSDIDNVAQWIILPYLKEAGIERIDTAVITHPHRDHFGGFLQLVYSIPIREVIYSTESLVITPNDPQANKGDDVLYKKLFAAFKEKGIPMKKARLGDSFNWGNDVFVKLLHADNPAYPANTNPNDRSLVFKVTTGTVSYMMTADAELFSENEMLNAFPNILESTVLKVGHHGSRTATSLPWLKALKPLFAVVSVGVHNSYGHPHPTVMQRLADADVKTFRTDQEGFIESQTDGNTVQFSAAQPPALLVQHLIEAERSTSGLESLAAFNSTESMHRLVIKSLQQAIDNGQTDLVEQAIQGRSGPAIDQVKNALRTPLKFRQLHGEATPAEESLLQEWSH